MDGCRVFDTEKPIPSCFRFALAVVLLAEPLMRVFIADRAIIADGALMMRWQAAGMVFAAVVLLYTCLFQASGRSVPALIMSVSRQGLLFIAVFLAAAALWQHRGFLIAQPAADALSAALALILYKTAFRNAGETGAEASS